MLTRCFPEAKERSSLALLVLGPWEMQEARAQGMPLLDRGDALWLYDSRYNKGQELQS